jgi:adenosylcobyric acid synthase
MTQTAAACVEIAVVRLPHLANFDEFAHLAAEPGVALRYVTRPEEMRAPDLVILPGTKATIPDLLWLEDRSLGARIRWLAQHRTPVLGVCGGYQMLGTVVSDPRRTESDHASAPGLGLLPMESELTDVKRLVHTRGCVSPDVAGLWAPLAGLPIAGYEIHMGRTDASRVPPLLRLEDGPDGAVSADGLVAGTYLHGVWERTEARHALVRTLAAARGYAWQPGQTPARDAYDALADVIEAAVRLDWCSVMLS